MKGTKSVKTLSRKAIKLQEKIIKSIQEIKDSECNLDAWHEAYTRLPSDLEEARARAIEEQAVVDAALEQLSKPLDEYRYDGEYYGHRRYSSEKAQTAWDATRQAEHSKDRLEILQAESTKTVEEYTKPGIESLRAAWDAWHEHNTLLSATMARIRTITRRDIIDLAELAQDAKKSTEAEEIIPPAPPLPHDVQVPAGALAVDAKQLYEAARAVKQTSKLSSLPVLNHALIRVTDDGLKITTVILADNEQGKEAKTKTIHYHSNGARFETCVPAKTFTDWLKVAAEYKETLVLGFDPSVQILQVRTSDSRAEFKCLEACEFPPC